MTPKGESNFKLYCFKDTCQVLQSLDDTIRKQCKQHIKNIEKNIYKLRDKNKRYAPKLEEKIKITKLGRKLNFLREHFNSKQDDLKLLEKIYTFKCYDKDGNIITTRSRLKVAEIEITSMFCVEEDWYFRTGKFLIV